MLNLFESVESISPEEYSIVIEYLSKPMSFTDIPDMDFWDEYLYALTLSKPNEEGQRYYILADEDGTKIPLKHQFSQDIFQHEVILLGNKIYFYLNPCHEATKSIRMAVHYPTQSYILIKKLLQESLLEKDFHLLSPEVYIYPGFYQNNTAYQVMRYLGKNLLSYCEKITTIQQLDHLIDAVMQEVKNVHQRGIIHTDIKPENFCIEEIDGQIKAHLIDYDDCLMVDETSPMDGFYGSLPYYAPEFFSKTPLFVQKARQLNDFGKCLHEKLFQTIPFFIMPKKQKNQQRSNSLSALTKPSFKGFLSGGHISEYLGPKMTLYYLEDYLLKEEWRQQISQKSDIYALGVMLAFDFKIPKTSKYFYLAREMLAQEPQKRFEFQNHPDTSSSFSNSAF